MRIAALYLSWLCLPIIMYLITVITPFPVPFPEPHFVRVILFVSANYFVLQCLTLSVGLCRACKNRVGRYILYSLSYSGKLSNENLSRNN